MRKNLKLVPATLAAAGLVVVGGCSAERLKAGAYEMFRTSSTLQSSPPERLGKPDAPDYAEYERQRKEQSR